MPRGDVSRQIGLYADNAPPGCMGGMLHMFDWNSALLGKKLLTDPDFNEGIEAPRNSLDTSSGERGSSETPKTSSVKKEDILFSYKMGKAGSAPPPPPARDPPRDPPRDSVSLDSDKRRRSTSVVARLMGLDPLPDASSTQSSVQQQPQSQPQTPSNQQRVSKEKLVTAQQRLAKDVKAEVRDVKVATEQVKAAAGPYSKSAREMKVLPPDLGTPRLSESKAARDVSNAKTSQQQRAEVQQLQQLLLSETEEDFDYPASREHPQEKQLQEFKKQFATKLAIQSHENRQRRQSESFNREVEVKRIMVQEKMNEAKAVLAKGEKNDPKRLAAALDKLNKSKEFQEVLEVLQSNKEFFLKFLQEPNAILFDKHLQEPQAEETMYNNTAAAAAQPQPVEVVKKSKPESKPKDSTEKKSKGGISPSSFARRFMESRRGHGEPKQKKSQSSSKFRTDDDTPTPSTSSSTPTASMRDSKPVAGERELTVRTSHEHIKQTSSYEGYSKKDPYSPGKIVLLRPGSNESTEISSPASAPNYSPRHFRLVKESKDLRAYPVESRLEQQLYREPSRSSSKEKSRHSVDSWENSAGEETPRQSKESARLRSKERERERERSKESRDIARDIIREARAGIVRELGRAEVPSRVGEVALTRNGSTGRRITLLRMATDSGEVTGSSDGEGGTPSSALGRDYSQKSGSATALSSPASVRTVRSQDSTMSSSFGSSKLAEQKRRERERAAAAEKEKEAALLAVQLEEQQHHLQKGLSTPRKSLSSAPMDPNRSSSPRRSSSQMSSKVLRKAIVGSLLETQVLSDAKQQHQQQQPTESYHKSSNEKMLLPKLLLKGERVVSNLPSEDESAVNSPRTLQRCRSVPNAAVLRERARAELPLPQQQPQQHQQQQSQTSRSISPLSHPQRSHEQAAIPEPRSVVHPTPPPPPPPPSSSSKPFADSYKRGVEAVGSLFARAKSKERNKIFVRSRKKSLSDDLSETSEPSVAATDDYRECAHHPYEMSIASDIASPLEWSGRLNLPSHEDSEAEASEVSDVKRISICSDAASYEQPTAVSRPVVEQDLIQALSMLTPRGQVRVNVDMATDQCCNSPAATEHCNSPMSADPSCTSPVITDVLEVPAVEHAARNAKFRSLATEDSRNDEEEDEEEEVLEVCPDRGGQPSPISVLDSPFEELESPSPHEFKEITSDLQELRIRLRLLKLDGNDRPRPSLDSTQESDLETPQVHCQELIVREAENSAESTDCYQQQSKAETPKSSSLELGLSAAEAISRDRALLESIDLEGFPYPEGRKEDLVYVRDLLVASEFVQSPAKVFTRWHSPNQPLDPILFENLEDYYNGCQPQFVIKDGHIKKNPGANAEFVAKLDHRLLFDAVNDVLLKKLGPYMTFHPWVQPSTPLLLRPMPSGRQLVLETWTELCSSFPSCVSDASNSLLERDLSKSNDWMCQRENLEQIGLELERAVLNDLIDETVLALTQLGY